jgi:type I restriction enzyme S subunit
MTYPLVKFGDVIRQVKDKVDPQKSGLERYIAGEHMDTDNLHIRRWGTIGDNYLGPAFHMRFKPGQVLYGSRRTYLRKVAFAEFEGITANTTYVLESKDPDVLLPELLPFIMQTDSFNEHSVKQSKGSVNPYINFSDIDWYEFPLPPVDEQHRIADLLWAADDVVTRWQEVLESLEKLKNSASIMLFGENDKAEWIPCDALCNEITVGIVVTPAKFYVEKGIPALRSLNIFPDKFVLDELVFISPKAHEIHSKSRLSKGDVVIVRTGRPGDAAVINSELDGCNCIDLIIARPSERISPSYLSRYINSAAGRRRISQGTAGTAQLHFNVSQMKKMPIPLVSLDMQNEIVSELDAIDKQIQEVTNHISLSKQLKIGLSRHLLLS